MLEGAAFTWRFDEDAHRVIRIPQPEPVMAKCTACQEEHRVCFTAKAPCYHTYCRGCLENLFKQSMKDESLYPPRCCKNPIPVESIRGLLTKELTADFINREEEIETKDRTYCHVATCSTLIRPYTINGDLAHCPRCRATSCTECKAKFHDGACPRDDGLDLLLETAKVQKWQRCSECKRMVELKQGCNHIWLAK